MNAQIRSTARVFQEKHEGVKINLEILPKKKADRELRLEQLRTQIMAGGGPDGFLLPTSMSGTPAPMFLQNPPEPDPSVFSDVELAMQNGLFADVSAYYNADTELHTEALQQTVMEAGVVDGARYVLPLRYEMAVAYIDTEQMTAEGLDLEKMKPSVYAYWNEVQSSDRGCWKMGGRYYWGAKHAQFIPKLFDYEAGEVAISKQELRTFLEEYQKMRAENAYRVVNRYLDFCDYWWDRILLPEELPAEIYTLDVALTVGVAAKLENRAVAMLPLRDGAGETVARITYFAAVGVGSKHPDWTYEFLREFLGEDCQWQRKRQTMIDADISMMVDAGWPVRNAGSVEPLWEYGRRVCKTIRSNYGVKPSQQRWLINAELQEEDVPVVATPIDRAYFDNDSIERILAAHLNTLNDIWSKDAPADVDLDQVAEDILAELEQYLAEG